MKVFEQTVAHTADQSSFFAVPSLTVCVLAGGKSERMGQPKGLLPWHGSTTWLEAQLRAISRALQFSQTHSLADQHTTGVKSTCQDGATPTAHFGVQLVLGYHSHCYLNALPWLNDARHSPQPLFDTSVTLQVHCNPNPEQGPFSSLHTALQACHAAHCAQEGPHWWVGVCPVDVPFVDLPAWGQLWNALCAEHASTKTKEHQALAISPELAGRSGHPVLLSPAFWLEHLLAVDLTSPEARLDVQLRAVSHHRRVPVTDPRVGLNLNTPEAFEQARAQFSLT